LIIWKSFNQWPSSLRHSLPKTTILVTIDKPVAWVFSNMLEGLPSEAVEWGLALNTCSLQQAPLSDHFKVYCIGKNCSGCMLCQLYGYWPLSSTH
jgi:hypothetical protein